MKTLQFMPELSLRTYLEIVHFAIVPYLRRLLNSRLTGFLPLMFINTEP